ncbi:unnamed protein product [Larinioides sclopetarius]|uniref:Uncharacterized protein n=1 Tax=Larinioides sclopetarius TaxID=280406 RepID=A0AAV2A996_9ARAC
MKCVDLISGEFGQSRMKMFRFLLFLLYDVYVVLLPPKFFEIKVAQLFLVQLICFTTLRKERYDVMDEKFCKI